MADEPEVHPLDHDADGKKGGSVPRGRPKTGEVTCEVTKNGHEKVCTGEWDAQTNAAAVYVKGDVFRVSKDIADALEDRGFVVIR